MTEAFSVLNRIAQAGVNIHKISQTSVLMKCGAIKQENLVNHAVYPLLRGLGALGFGAIHLCGAVDYYDQLDEIIMVEANFTQHPGLWLSGQMAQLPQCDIIIDLSNEPESQLLCTQLSSALHIPCVFLMWNNNWVVASTRPLMKDELPQRQAGDALQYDYPPITRIASGLALQEIIGFAGRIEPMAEMRQVVLYNSAAGDRQSKVVSFDWQPVRIEDAVIEVVGAGGIGVHMLESLVPMLGSGCELRIFDYDIVGPENLASQTTYSVGDVGRAKVDAIVEKLKLLRHPELKITPLQMSYQHRPEGLTSPCLRILCPDNLKLRYHANTLSLVDGVPVVEAGSTILAAATRSYVPGQTACLEHRIRNLAEKAANEKQPTSCAETTALTLPPTNMVIGGILADEALKVLSPERFGLPSSGTVMYDVREPARFGIVDVQPPCHHQG